MGILSKLTAILNGPYNYRAGPNTLGIGVENLALVQPGIAEQSDFNSPRYAAQRTMGTRFPMVLNEGQMLPYTDLRGNGLYLSGTLELQGLIADYNEAQK